MTTYAIGDRLGCSATLVQQWMRRQGIARRPASAPKTVKLVRPSRMDQHADQLRVWSAEGLGLREMAARLGTSKQAVSFAMIRHNIPRPPKHSAPGHLNGSWKGGRQNDGDGYILVYSPNHPHRTRAGYVREHRLVMERILGRYLLPTEVMDHIDGNRSNNDPANLRVFASNREHLAATLQGRVPKWSEEGKERIRQGNLQRIGRQRASSRSASGTDAPSSP